MSENRTKINMRENFTTTDRKIILIKSNNRCSHCGKNLTVKNVTVEHVIPLSKGGTNHISNLVGLCKKCNTEKSNSIVHPSYYRYLKKDYKDSLIKQFENYINEEWFDLQTFFPQDIYTIPNYNAVRCLYKGEMPEDFYEKYHNIAMSYGHYNLIRSRFKDIPYICEYYKLKSKKKKVTDWDSNRLIKHLEFCLTNGAIFTLINNKEIVGVIMMSINCEYYNGDVTFFVTMESDYLRNKFCSNFLDDYITLLMIKGIMKYNKFNNLNIKKIIKEGTSQLKGQYTANCLKYYVYNATDKFNEINHYIFVKNDNGKIKQFYPNGFPRETCRNSDYFNKIYNLSKVDDQAIDTGVKEMIDYCSKEEIDIRDQICHVGTLLRNDRK